MSANPWILAFFIPLSRIGKILVSSFIKNSGKVLSNLNFCSMSKSAWLKAAQLAQPPANRINDFYPFNRQTIQTTVIEGELTLVTRILFFFFLLILADLRA